MTLRGKITSRNIFSRKNWSLVIVPKTIKYKWKLFPYICNLLVILDLLNQGKAWTQKCNVKRLVFLYQRTPCCGTNWAPPSQTEVAAKRRWKRTRMRCNYRPVIYGRAIIWASHVWIWVLISEYQHCNLPSPSLPVSLSLFHSPCLFFINSCSAIIARLYKDAL